MIGTINESVASGWRAGPLVTIGHGVVEIGIVLLIVGGLGSFIGSATWLISLFGELALIIFGYLTLASARGRCHTHTQCRNQHRPGDHRRHADEHFKSLFLDLGALHRGSSSLELT